LSAAGPIQIENQAQTKKHRFAKGNKAAKGFGAPRGIRNALRHGMRSKKLLPSGAEWIEGELNSLHDSLMADVLAIRGRVSTADRNLIAEAVTWERASLLAVHHVIEGADNLTTEKRMESEWKSAQAQRNKNKAIAELGITNSNGGFFDAFFSSQTSPIEEQP
jgi:uncharacterized protein YjcR